MLTSKLDRQGVSNIVISISVNKVSFSLSLINLCFVLMKEGFADEADLTVLFISE